VSQIVEVEPLRGQAFRLQAEDIEPLKQVSIASSCLARESTPASYPCGDLTSTERQFGVRAARHDELPQAVHPVRTTPIA
jgi:hypothetical protein